MKKPLLRSDIERRRGVKMKEISHRAQVFAVTHLAAVAALADYHFRIELFESFVELSYPAVFKIYSTWVSRPSKKSVTVCGTI